VKPSKTDCSVFSSYCGVSSPAPGGLLSCRVQLQPQFNKLSHLCALYTIQIVSKQLYRDKQENNESVMQTEFNSAVKQL